MAHVSPDGNHEYLCEKDTLEDEIARLRAEVEQCENQIASTADFLNTCLREANLDGTQVGINDLKPGIDALYFRLQKAEAVVRAAEPIVKAAAKADNSNEEYAPICLGCGQGGVFKHLSDCGVASTLQAIAAYRGWA